MKILISPHDGSNIYNNNETENLNSTNNTKK